MFKDKQNEWNDVWEDELDDFNGQGFSLPGGFVAAIVVIVVVLSLVTVGFFGYRWWRQSQPDYAAEEWFNALWEGEGETVLDRTCDREAWLSNAVNSGSMLTAMGEYFSLIDPSLVEEFLPVEVDLDSLQDEVELDRSQIEIEEVENNGQTAIVTAQGQLRIRVFQGWFPYRLDETWLMVREDDRWKWCGRQP
jgi:hypothetical protein